MNRYFLFIFSFVLAQGALFASQSRVVPIEEAVEIAREINPEEMDAFEKEYKRVMKRLKTGRILDPGAKSPRKMTQAEIKRYREQWEQARQNKVLQILRSKPSEPS